jgi:polysaccharide pyruvyl transferase WcaK-like protein
VYGSLCCDSAVEVFHSLRGDTEAETPPDVFIGAAGVPRKEGNVKERERKRKKIAFFGHFGQGNFGNEGTLQAILEHVRRFVPDAQLACITSGTEGTAATHDIEAIPIAEILVKSWRPRNPLFGLMRILTIGVISEPYRWVKGIITLRGTNMFIIPGTGLLTDAYGLLSWGPYNLFKWSLTAKLCRCKLLFVSVGAGPIYGVLARWLVKSALSLADFRSYRDNSTIQYLNDIGFKTHNDRVYPDLVFSLPQAVMPHQDTKKSRRPVIGLGLMYYAGKYSVPNPRNETYLAYLENLLKVVRWLIAHEYNVRLLIGDLWDLGVTQEFRRLLKEQLSAVDERHIIDEPVSSVEQLLSQLAATDMVVATRFHNVLLALLSNKPVIAISFHHKCASLMDAMGLSEYCLDINTLNADNLIEKIRDLEKNAGDLKPVIRQMSDEFRKALDEQYKFIFQGDVGCTTSTRRVRFGPLRTHGTTEEVQKHTTAGDDRLRVSQG